MAGRLRGSPGGEGTRDIGRKEKSVATNSDSVRLSVQ